MLSPGLLNVMRDYWLEARPEGWLFPPFARLLCNRLSGNGQTQDKPNLIAAAEPGVYVGKAYGRYLQTRDVAHVVS